ncbi:hypothetical protein [Agrococcus jejuensis]|uniref:Uncharacterized protein n=1 Tax=Agrococcus jejuensis TaxID=399736 RepID=A0A1G8GI45_9MICO|nr:hypothetical protein [Agrococcus jejuensis]SDH94053.1 hypothetical protein SAMN04489720_2943 [Agrococcus jejuensis]
MRRAFLWIMIASVVVLPVWVLVGRALFGAPLAQAILPLALLAPFLAAQIGVVTGLTYARKEVRGPKAVTWHDVRVVGPWLLAIVVLGMLVVDGTGAGAASALTALVGAGALTASNALAAVLGLLVVLGGLVIAYVQLRMLLLETRARVQAYVDEVSHRPIVAPDAVFEKATFERADGPQAGRTIRIERTTTD